MIKTKSHDLNNQSFKICDGISVIVLFFLITSILSIFSVDLLSNLINLDVFEFLKAITIFVNMWSLGFMIFDILFVYIIKDVFKEVVETNLNSNQLVLRFVLLPIAFGIISIYIFGLLTTIIFNILNLNQVQQRISILYFLFYLCELSLTVIFVSMNYSEIKGLLSNFFPIKMQFTLIYNIKNYFMNGNLFKNSSLFFISILSLIILIISVILGEIDYNFGFFNLMLVYLFFLGIILLLFSYLKFKHNTPYLDMILIFILVFSLSHIFISRGVTIVGRTDIHKEFFHAQNTVMKMNWDPNEFEDNYNTIISISLFPMILSIAFSIKIETFFELITPIIFGLFNVTSYIILVRLHSRYHTENNSENNILPSTFYIIFSLLVMIFIRSYTHQIAASSRITIAYFLFNIFCSLLIDNKLLYGFKRVPILLILLFSVLLSHWGTFLFGIAVIIASFIFFVIYLSLKRYNLMIEYLKEIKKSTKKPFVFIVVFALIIILWYFLLSPRITIFIIEYMLPSIENLFNNGTAQIIQAIISLITNYRILSFSNPIIFLETMVNLLFILILSYSNVSKIVIVFRLKNIKFSDFFLFSTFFFIALMFLIPVLSSFYSPLRVGMQFWPFIAPIFFLKISPNREFLFKMRLHLLLKNIFTIRAKSFLTVFLFLIFIFHQGIVYEIVYNGELQSSEVFEAGESLSLVFRNYGVEAWKWLLTESDLEALQWLNLQSPVSICADYPRAHMILARINGMTPEDSIVYNSWISIRHLIETNSTEFIKKDSLIFISIQNLNSGFMFFHYSAYSTFKLISQLKNLNASLVYNDRTQIYYLQN